MMNLQGFNFWRSKEIVFVSLVRFQFVGDLKLFAEPDDTL
jgi:hypothetical protein